MKNKISLPKHFRESLSDTTLAEFKERVDNIIAKVHEEHLPDTPVRQFTQRRYREDSISCWTGKFMIHVTVSQERSAK